MMHDLQMWVHEHWMLVALLCVLIGLIAAYLLYAMWEYFNSMSERERTFKRGRTNLAQTIRVELLERMKKKKKRPF